MNWPTKPTLKLKVKNYIENSDEDIRHTIKSISSSLNLRTHSVRNILQQLGAEGEVKVVKSGNNKGQYCYVKNIFNDLDPSIVSRPSSNKRENNESNNS